MFYLLENNKIIETNSAEWYCGRLKVILNEEERYKYRNHIFWNSKDGYYKYFTVKKQSNNVFDLIEKGDLVKVQYYDSTRPCLIFDVNSIFTYEDGIKEFAILGMSWTENQVLAIYKPDDKGNYIKVWEREEEDDE